MSDDGGIEFDSPLTPTEEELRQMQKEQSREKLQVLDGGKNSSSEKE